MSTTDRFERLTGAWLADGPTELPDRVLHSALEEIHRHPRRRLLASWRQDTMSSMLKLAAAAAVLVAAIAAGSMLLDRGAGPRVGGPQPSPSAPTPSADASPTATPAASASLFGGRGGLEAGRYTTDLVRPGLTMELPCCFEVTYHDSALLVLGERGLNRFLLFSNATQVLDPATDEWAPLPDSLVGWLEEHPGLSVGSPTEVDIAGRSALTVEGAATQDAAFQADGDLALTRAPATIEVAINAQMRFRVAVLEGGAEPLHIWTIARADGFEEFSATAQDVLETLVVGTGAP